jgi:hypothetical protein
MSKSTISATKKRRGRPRLYVGGQGAPQIGLRLPPSELAAVDHWIRKHAPDSTRPQAIRRLVKLGLKAKAK